MFLSVISRASTALLNELWYVGCCSRESSLVCLKICLEHKSNVILCKPPIRSTANHFLKLRLWGLVLKPHLVECWKVHLVFSPHPFYSDPCRAHEKAMKFSVWVEGSFMLQENQTKPKQNFMFQLSYGSLYYHHHYRPTRCGMTPGSQTFGCELRVRKRVAKNLYICKRHWEEIHGKQNVNYVCLYGVCKHTVISDEKRINF